MKIYVFCNHCDLNSPAGEIHHGVAIAEDGHALAGHASSNHAWLEHDMGLNGSDWQHDKYRAHYPEGFELVYIEDPANDERLTALALAHSKTIT